MKAVESRIPTWGNIGEDVQKATNIQEALNFAGLDFEVNKHNMFTDGGIMVPGHMATVREDNGSVLGVVSNNYQICQNSEAFDFVNYIDEDVQFAKAGMTDTGMVYVIGKLPTVNILGDDFDPYVIFQNSHNGRYCLRATITPLRIVCQNQFNYAFANSRNTITIKHSKQMDWKIPAARDTLKSINEMMQNLGEEANRMASEKISKADFERFVTNMFPIKGDILDPKQIEKAEAIRAEFINAYNAEDNRNFHNTVWGLVNAYSDFETHKNPGRKTENWEEGRFLTVTFNPIALGMFEQLAYAA